MVGNVQGNVVLIIFEHYANIDVLMSLIVCKSLPQHILFFLWICDEVVLSLLREHTNED